MVMDIVRVDSLESYKTDHYTKTAVMYATAYLYEHREDARPPHFNTYSSFPLIWEQTGGVLGGYCT